MVIFSFTAGDFWGVVVADICCHSNRNTLELMLPILCLENVVLEVKNSKQYGTVKALAGLFAEAKVGTISESTFWPFGYKFFTHLQENRKRSLREFPDSYI